MDIEVEAVMCGEGSCGLDVDTGMRKAVVDIREWVAASVCCDDGRHKWNTYRWEK